MKRGCGKSPEDQPEAKGRPRIQGNRHRLFVSGFFFCAMATYSMLLLGKFQISYFTYGAALVNAFVVTRLSSYAFGLNGQRQIFSMCVLALAITLVLAVIIDLDRPRSAFIRISQQSMIDLQRGP
jgi:hypothetical protein